KYGRIRDEPRRGLRADDEPVRVRRAEALTGTDAQRVGTARRGRRDATVDEACELPSECTATDDDGRPSQKRMREGADDGLDLVRTAPRAVVPPEVVPPVQPDLDGAA